VVFPVFAHEPTVSRAPSGEFVMFFTSSHGQKEIPCTGKSCFGHNGTSDISCPNDQQCTIDPPEPLLTQMSFASKPAGPWSTPVLVPSPGAVDTNMACIVSGHRARAFPLHMYVYPFIYCCFRFRFLRQIYANSSLFCMGRPGIGLLTATHWKNLSTYSDWTNPSCSGCDFRGEDPMVRVGRG
jgi:hypothetical protein